MDLKRLLEIKEGLSKGVLYDKLLWKEVLQYAISNTEMLSEAMQQGIAHGQESGRFIALEEAIKEISKLYTGVGSPDDPHPDAVLVNSTINYCIEKLKELQKG